MNEIVFIPLDLDDIELIMAALSDYIRFYDLEDIEPLLNRDDIEDLLDYFIEAREKYFEYEEDDIDE